VIEEFDESVSELHAFDHVVVLSHSVLLVFVVRAQVAVQEDEPGAKEVQTNGNGAFQTLRKGN